MKHNDKLIVCSLIAMLFIATLTIFKDAKASGTGSFISDSGAVLTNKHVAFDGGKTPLKHFMVNTGYQVIPYTLVKFGQFSDFAILVPDKAVSTTCNKLVVNPMLKNTTVHPIMFNLLDLDYTKIFLRKQVFNVTIKSNVLLILEQNSYEIEPVVRPGNSGSAVLDENGKLISVVFAAQADDMNYKTFKRKYNAGFILSNERLLELAKSAPAQFRCTNESIIKTDTLVWIVPVEEK